MNIKQVINTMKLYAEGKTPTKKRWVCKYNEDTCAFCKKLHGQTVKLSDTFKMEGYKLNSPPAHPGCNCVIEKVK